MSNTCAPGSGLLEPTVGRVKNCLTCFCFCCHCAHSDHWGEPRASEIGTRNSNWTIPCLKLVSNFPAWPHLVPPSSLLEAQWTFCPLGMVTLVPPRPWSLLSCPWGTLPSDPTWLVSAPCGFQLRCLLSTKRISMDPPSTQCKCLHSNPLLVCPCQSLSSHLSCLAWQSQHPR